MSDYLKSALGYLNGGGNTNDFVGQILEINNVKIRVNRLIAEGGWALVFAVEDVATGKEYALKRLIAVDDEANKTILQEIDILKKLSGHKNIIQYMCAQRIERDDKRTCEYLIVTEYCQGGTLADLFRNISTTNLTLEQICKIAYQVTRAIHHLHNQQPKPIIHWDIKLENFLISNDGTIKLCDFGSASTQQIQPDSSWNAQKRANLEDQMSKFTTPMYRSPEMIDTWNNEPIGPPADCWALGCILYILVTLRHPFPDGNKLAIVNAKYTQLPSNPRTSCINDLIKGCLEASPLKRMTTSMVLERLASIAETNNFDPREAVKIDIKAPPPPRPIQSVTASPSHLPSRPPPPKPSSPSLSHHHQSSQRSVSPTPPSPPPISRTNYLHKQLNNLQSSSSSSSTTTQSSSTSSVGSGLFSSLRGGAGNLFKNIKDTSSKVIQSVQQTMTKTEELDASYITSRIIVMPYPDCGIEYVVTPNYIDDVRDYLKFKHPPPAKIQYYNLTKGKTNVTRLNGKHIDCNFAYTLLEINAPLLSALYQICEDIYCYLDDNYNNIIVTYCDDGNHTSATIICSLLLYCGALNNVDETIELFKTRRCQLPLLQPSELRYINYINMLHNGLNPHTKTLVLRSIIIQPIPLFNRAKDGCRPYADIYSNGSLIYSTKRSEYDDMKLFNQHEGKICLILNDTIVCGDIMIILYHARQQLGRIIGIKMASLQFYTGYVPINESTMIFDYKDLDNVQDIGGTSFKVILNVMISDDNLKISKNLLPWESKTNDIKNLKPDPLFSSTLEMEETLDNFRLNKYEKKNITSMKVPKRPPPPKIIQQEIHNKYEPEKEPLNPSSINDEIINNNNNNNNNNNDGDDDNNNNNSSNNSNSNNNNNNNNGGNDDNIAEADLLNLGINLNLTTNNNNNNILNDDDNNKNTNDIFGNFTSFKQTNIDNKQTTNDLLFDTTINKQQNNNNSNNNGNINNFIFDPLGGSANNANNNDIFGNWTNTNKQSSTTTTTTTTTNIKTPTDDNFPRNSSVPNFQAQNKDPFANLAGSMSTGLNTSWNGTPKDSNTPQSSSPCTTGTPVHSSPHMQNKINIPNDLNYSDVTSVFNNNTKSSTSSTTTTKPGDIFEDLLGSQGYNFSSSRKTDKDSPKTINQMRKVEAAKTMDPEKLKVAEWTEGKKSNLRALLCSLHTVLWSDADRWQKCEMHQLVTAAEVKKAYRKACLAVHPDKQAGTDNENLAKLIFMELNNAWSIFENDATQQNLFS